jgi:hypothetical protein
VIYDHPTPADAIDQGDLIERCPVVIVERYDASSNQPPDTEIALGRVIVLTQTCDFANDKVTTAVVAEVTDARVIVDRGLMKAAEVRGNLRSGRIWGMYFLPSATDLGLPEMIVDLRRLHTVRLDLPRDLCRAGFRRGRVRPPYREHLAKHFADTYSRIGLPQRYETMP